MGSSNVDYSKQINQALDQSNTAKMPLTQEYANLFGNAAPDLMSALLNVQSLGNSYINSNGAGSNYQPRQYNNVGFWGSNNAANNGQNAVNKAYDGLFQHKDIIPGGTGAGGANFNQMLSDPNMAQNLGGAVSGVGNNPYSQWAQAHPSTQPTNLSGWTFKDENGKLVNPGADDFTWTQNQFGAWMPQPASNSKYGTASGQSFLAAEAPAGYDETNGFYGDAGRTGFGVNPSFATGVPGYTQSSSTQAPIDTRNPSAPPMLGGGMNPNNYGASFNNQINPNGLSANFNALLNNLGGIGVQPIGGGSQPGVPGGIGTKPLHPTGPNGPTIPGGIGTQPVGPKRPPFNPPPFDPTGYYNGTGGGSDTGGGGGNPNGGGAQIGNFGSSVNLSPNGMPNGINLPALLQAFQGNPAQGIQSLLGAQGGLQSLFNNSQLNPGQIQNIGQNGGANMNNINLNSPINHTLGGLNSNPLALNQDTNQTFGAISDILNQQMNKNLADTRERALSTGNSRSTGESYDEGTLRAQALPQLAAALNSVGNSAVGNQLAAQSNNGNILNTLLGGNNSQNQLGLNNFFSTISANQNQMGLSNSIGGNNVGGANSLASLLSGLNQFNAQQGNNYNLTTAGMNQQSSQNTINQQMQMLQMLFGSGLGLASQGIPGGGSSVNIGNSMPQGGGLGGMLGGLGGLLGGLGSLGVI